jgi:hypothetical protein
LFLCAKDVTPVGERKDAYMVWVGDLTEINHSESLGADGKY